MGRIRDFFSQGNDVDAGVFTPMMSEAMFEYTTNPSLDLEWSLMRYRDEVYKRCRDDQQAAEAWDELEKSVVAKVADDVKVSIRGRTVEMTIVKKLSA